MRYMVLAAGLLMSFNGFALEDDKSHTLFDKAVVSKISKSACQSFCQQYGVDYETCDVSMSGGHSSGAPTTDSAGNTVPAFASGSSVALSYNVICKSS